ncbi:Exocyst complex component Exo70 protein [Dioscorea alata]|uniref:Exocyst complex component Exo70 protein n=2 Tax=Dioscorea alata TaxID=55571 RepID=A0ACB7WJ82_DIOAL|nr:Exocyst complex component Exo70 protein [Dioscorea alata]
MELRPDKNESESETESLSISKLRVAREAIASLLSAAVTDERALTALDLRLSVPLSAVSAASTAVTGPLSAQLLSSRALHHRIDRSLTPSLSLLRSLSLSHRLHETLSHSPDAPLSPDRLIKFIDRVDRLQSAIADVAAGVEPAIGRLQETVEFLSRTKATDQFRIRRLGETLNAIRALYEAEVDAMQYEGMLDDALVKLQDEFERILAKIRHRGVGDEVDDGDLGEDTKPILGSDAEVDALRRIVQTLAANDCLDISIDIYVKVRYRCAAKALMRLNPEYLKTYSPEEIDGMQWETLEFAITLWIQHFNLALNSVFVAEKQLCSRVLSPLMDSQLWPECFAKIADKIMAVFFRFGEGVARSSREPQKLFKLLDMFDALDRIRHHFMSVFDGDSGSDICVRFRELLKLVVHASSKVFWEFGLQIEGLQDGVPPPPDGSVPKIVRYAVNYLKFLSSESYSAAMGRVLRTEQVWKAGVLSRPDPEDSVLRDAMSNILDALQRNVEAKRARYKDKVLPHIFAMNSYWYIYMRTKGSELGKLVGEESIKRKYKTAAEEAAYSYQAQAWGKVVDLLDSDEDAVTKSNELQGKEAAGVLARVKIESFMKSFEENLRKHKTSYCIPDPDLKEQIKGAVAKLVVPSYASFLQANAPVLQGRSLVPPDTLKGLLRKLFDGMIGGNMSGELVRRPTPSEGEVSRRRRFKDLGGSDNGRLA